MSGNERASRCHSHQQKVIASRHEFDTCPLSSTTGRHPIRMSVFCMPGVVLRCLLLWCFVAAGVPGVGCAFCAGLLGVPVGGGLPAFVDCCPDRSPAAARPARPLAVRAASFARRVGSKPGQAPPPTTGTAAWPRRCPPVRPCPPDPPAPFTPAAPARCVVSTSGQAPPPPTGAAGWPSGPSGALHTCGPGRWRVLGASARSPAALLSLAVTHVKPSTPLLACALSPVKPTIPLHARYTHFWCYFIAQRRRGFHTGVLRFPHWC